MAIKKTKEMEINGKKASRVDRYFYAVGRRKTSIAKVKLYPAKGVENSFLINEKEFEKYFPIERLREEAKAPLALAGEGNKFNITVKVIGGGVSSQADAVKLGIARALIIFDETLKKSLKDKKYLTRNPREVERKKPGLKKARRAPQWAKR
jgi:small subunit ribosomal protein S9